MMVEIYFFCAVAMQSLLSHWAEMPHTAVRQMKMEQAEKMVNCVELGKEAKAMGLDWRLVLSAEREITLFELDENEQAKRRASSFQSWSKRKPEKQLRKTKSRLMNRARGLKAEAGQRGRCLLQSGDVGLAHLGRLLGGVCVDG